jgi:hypothetical protein
MSMPVHDSGRPRLGPRLAGSGRIDACPRLATTRMHDSHSASGERSCRCLSTTRSPRLAVHDSQFTTRTVHDSQSTTRTMNLARVQVLLRTTPSGHAGGWMPPLPRSTPTAHMRDPSNRCP